MKSRLTLEMLSDEVINLVNKELKKSKKMVFFLKHINYINILFYISLLVFFFFFAKHTGKYLLAFAIILFITLLKSISFNFFFLKAKKYKEVILLYSTNVDVEIFLDNSKIYISNNNPSYEYIKIHKLIMSEYKELLKLKEKLSKENNEKLVEKIRSLMPYINKETYENYNMLSNINNMPRIFLIIEYIKIINHINLPKKEYVLEIEELLKFLEVEKSKKYEEEFLEFLDKVIEDLKIELSKK